VQRTLSNSSSNRCHKFPGRSPPLVIMSYTTCVSVCSCCTIISIQPLTTMNESDGINRQFSELTSNDSLVCDILRQHRSIILKNINIIPHAKS